MTIDTVIYAVGIPWDSYRVSRVAVFTDRQKAIEFVNKYNTDENKTGQVFLEEKYVSVAD